MERIDSDSAHRSSRSRGVDPPDSKHPLAPLSEMPTTPYGFIRRKNSETQIRQIGQMAQRVSPIGTVASHQGI
jgi:hypothetical protein